MAKPARKPVLSDPAAGALEVVEQATAEEAEILSDLDAAAKRPKSPQKKTAARKTVRPSRNRK
jgi:hypothetical protein